MKVCFYAPHPSMPSPQVFNTAVAGVVDGIVRGHNGTIICTGRKGSGVRCSRETSSAICIWRMKIVMTPSRRRERHGFMLMHLPSALLSCAFICVALERQIIHAEWFRAYRGCRQRDTGSEPDEAVFGVGDDPKTPVPSSHLLVEHIL